MRQYQNYRWAIWLFPNFISKIIPNYIIHLRIKGNGGVTSKHRQFRITPKCIIYTQFYLNLPQKILHLPLTIQKTSISFPNFCPFYDLPIHTLRIDPPACFYPVSEAKQLIKMQGSRLHTTLEDQDSTTDFSFSELPVKVACGYRFCDEQEISTHEQSSDRSSLGLGSPMNFHKSKDDLGVQSQDGVYYESALRRHVSMMENAYAGHKIDEAASQAGKLARLCKKVGHKLGKSEQELADKIEREMEDVRYYQKVLTQPGWQLKQNKKNLKISTNIQTGTVGVLVQAFLDVQVENFFSVLIEIDLMKKWMPFMETSSLEKIVSRNCRIGHCINNFPLISKRESFFQGIGYDRIEHNKTVLLFTRSLNNMKQLQKQLQYQVRETEGAVQLDYKYLILEYRPETPSSGWLKLAINVDMKLSIPMFILAPATEGFGTDFYTNILKIAKNMKGSEWEQKIKENPEFFKFIKGRICAFFQTKQLQIDDK